MAPEPAPGVDPDRRRRRRRLPPRIRRQRRRRPPEPPVPRTGRPPGDRDRVSATVSTPGNTGVEEFRGTGDLTGTDNIQAVFSQGHGFAPQLHYGRNEVHQQQTAQQVSTQGTEEGG
jgi:hypothetical protein